MKKLELPQDHEVSLKLESQAAETSLSSRSEVIKTRVISPGLVELTLQSRKSCSCYGSRTWSLRVGGAGLGDDESNETLKMLGCLVIPPPVSVRFAVPIALHGVDDAGFCDASFWTDEMRKEPITLEAIALRAVQWLEGSHINNEEGGIRVEEERGGGEEWKTTERHARKGLDVIRNYAKIRACQPASSAGSNVSLVSCQKMMPEWIEPKFRKCFDSETNRCKKARISELNWSEMVTEIGTDSGIYTFDLFTPLFCDLLLAEVDAFEDTKLPCRRPNTMNKLGLVVNDIGLEPILTDILERLVDPMCRALYGEDDSASMITSALDHHHSFIVRYRNNATKTMNGTDRDEDDGSRGLDMHHDASEATLNVCLGRDNFTSGGLRFCGRYGDPDHRSSRNGALIAHSKGRAILHLGRHRHGADHIESGERINLIMWARNSAYRGAAAFGHVPLDGTPKRTETGEVDRLCLSKSNDRDYEEKIKILEARAKNSFA